MTITEAFVRLRNDIKSWCINNFNTKLNNKFSEEDAGKVLTIAADGSVELAINNVGGENPKFTGHISLNRLENSTPGDYSVALGYNCLANSSACVALGDTCLVPAVKMGEARGIWQGAIAEGNQTLAFGPGAHAEGAQLMGFLEYTISGEAGSRYYTIDTSKTVELCILEYKDNFYLAKTAEGTLRILGQSLNDDQALVDETVKMYVGSMAIGAGAHSEGFESYAISKNLMDFTELEEENFFGGLDFNVKAGLLEGCNHAEGFSTAATGSFGSHAEGCGTKASSPSSHAEGDGTEASGDSSHAEGDGTEAKGRASHAEGLGTVATKVSQHVEGKYNIIDENEEYLHIVGNGTSDNRSNAHTLDVDGNAWYAGDVSCVSLRPSKGIILQDTEDGSREYKIAITNGEIIAIPLFEVEE